MKSFLLFILLLVFTNTQAQLTHTFTQTAHNIHYGFAYGVTVGSDGTVFLIKGRKGIIAFTYSGNTGIDDELLKIPFKYELFQNYPNPFNPTTRIQFDLPDAAQVVLTVYNIQGQKIKNLLTDYKQAGSYDVVFDGTGLASGMYFYRLEADNYTQVKRMLLIK